MRFHDHVQVGSLDIDADRHGSAQDGMVLGEIGKQIQPGNGLMGAALGFVAGPQIRDRFKFGIVHHPCAFSLSSTFKMPEPASFTLSDIFYMLQFMKQKNARPAARQDER